MTALRSSLAISAAIVIATPAASHAAIVAFTGTANNTNAAPSADASCAPLLRLSFGPANSAGTSNLGNFTYQQTHCTTGGPGAYSGGLFSYLFDAGDVLTGTYSGIASLSGTTGLLNNTINYVITGGNGRFLGGSGAITGTGTVDFRQGLPRQSLTLSGQLNLPAVPEPASWMTMLAGFYLSGSALRYRKQTPGGAKIVDSMA